MTVLSGLNLTSDYYDVWKIADNALVDVQFLILHVEFWKTMN